MNKKIREIKVEEFGKYLESGYLTVDQLLNFINSKIESGELTKDSLVLSQRIEDIYFEKNGWGIVKKEGDHYCWFVEHNKKIDEGLFENKEKFPSISPENLKKISKEDLENSKEQYHPIWCPVVYKNDKNLYLDLHY